ncbi:prephenate dehydrogenase [bacterium]|nr:prephenate dehydrogenase [bacterium]
MADRVFKNVTIIGLGLMGSSLGKAIIKYCHGIKVTAVVRREEIVDKVISRKAAHNCTLNIEEGLKNADLVILSMPVKTICGFCEKISPFIKQGAVVTDMGSTKEKIIFSMRKNLPAAVNFIGSHPMAGSEKTGIDSSYAELFQNSICVLTPDETQNAQTTDKTKLFWESVGCEIKIMSAKTHDYLIGAISHIPHLMASILVNFASQVSSDNFSAIGFASTGFIDTTRIASGSVPMWQDICLSNKKNIVEHLNAIKDNIDTITDALVNNDTDKIKFFLKNAQKYRNNHLLKDK